MRLLLRLAGSVAAAVVAGIAAAIAVAVVDLYLTGGMVGILAREKGKVTCSS